MRLSTKGRYATRIMVCLQRHSDGGPLSKKDIGAEEGITADYVEQLLIKLRAAGLVQSHRGIHGGFTIAGDPAQITVEQVLDATEQTMKLAPCEKEHCQRKSFCATQPLWRKAEEALHEIFGKTTIADLASNPG